MGRGLIAGSADREDVDPTSTSIALEPCRVEDVLPDEFIQATYDLSAAAIKLIGAPDFMGHYTPYIVRSLNGFVSLGRFEDALRLLAVALACRRPSNWRHWAEVVWSPPRAPEYIGDMPHTWIGAEFVTAIRRMLVRENGRTLELFRAVPENWWEGEGIRLYELPTAFGVDRWFAIGGDGDVRFRIRFSGSSGGSERRRQFDAWIPREARILQNLPRPIGGGVSRPFSNAATRRAAAEIHRESVARFH